MSKEKIKHELELALKKYEEQSVKDVLSEIRKDLQNVMDTLIYSEEGVYSQDFPIEFENNLGRWKITKTGECFVQPNTDVCEINITIKPTIESYESRPIL